MADASTAPTSAALRVPKAAELVAAQIRRQIVTGELPEGTILPPESVLTARYRVSRPTLREAFRILESELLITVRRGVQGGARIHTPNAQVASRYAASLLQYRSTTLEDVQRARLLVEPPAAALVGHHGDPAAIDELAGILEEEAAALKSKDAEALRGAGYRFHRRLIELSGNRTLALFAAMLEQISDAHSARVQALERGGRGSGRYGKQGHADHERLVELLRAGAGAEAERFWRGHLDRVRGWLVKEADARTVLDLFG
jgi:DNA-binding FadR family transcriptional regulator